MQRLQNEKHAPISSKDVLFLFLYRDSGGWKGVGPHAKDYQVKRIRHAKPQK